LQLGTTIESEHLSEITEEELESSGATFNIGSKRLHGFLYWDLKYLRPFFTRRFTKRELKEGKSHITELTDKWFKDINRGSPLLLSESDDEEFNQDHD
jgi:sodium/hydrogen exchanger 8